MNRAEKLEFKLKEMSEIESKLWNEGIEVIAGVDEVGRGCLAGPVVASAVVLPKGWDIPGLDDSKKLSEKRREEMFEIIKEKAVAYSIGMVDNDRIDEINILEATKEAMIGAILTLNKKLKSKGKNQIETLLLDAVKLDKLNIPQKSIIKGDSKSISIAAASIMAKVTRDRLMKEWSDTYPAYMFHKNKGYGTKDHYMGIDREGICPIHRKSFLKKYFENK